MIKKMGALAVLGLAGVVFFAFGDDEPTAERVGYFKSEGNDRVMAFQASAPMSDAQARELLGRAMTTPGAVTMAVLYAPGDQAPQHKLTTAPDLAAAMRLVAERHPDWSHRLRVNPAGLQTFD